MLCSEQQQASSECQSRLQDTVPGHTAEKVSLISTNITWFLSLVGFREVMMVSTPSPFGSVAILRDGYSIAAGGVDGQCNTHTHTCMQHCNSE